MFTKDKIDPLVEEIAKRQTRPVIDASIQQIVDEIKERTGVEPSKSAVWLSLRRIGAVSSGRKFIYRHNEAHHE
jgi:hypothetical protein